MRKSVMITTKNVEFFDYYVNYYLGEKTPEDVTLSREVITMTDEFLANGWEVYLTTLFNVDFDAQVWRDTFCVNDKEKRDMTLTDVNDEISFMVIRNLGSVEVNRDIIRRYLNFVRDNYEGVSLNNAKSMLAGFSKYYLVETNRDRIAEIGLDMIDTKIFPNTVSYDELCDTLGGNADDYIIKPISGELSNSFMHLSNVDEDCLRYKESKVEGWIAQPIREEIWNGEYQMAFVGDEMVHAQVKTYAHDAAIPNQKKREINKYEPSQEEIQIGLALRKYFEEFQDTRIDIFRIDYMKQADGRPLLLEFESVNPGFFIGYMDENDTDIRRIVETLRKYCEGIIADGGDDC